MKLLRYAGQAIEALARSSEQGDADALDVATLDERKMSFSSAASSYFQTLSAIDVNLRREVNALEAANIIPGEADSKGSQRRPEIPPAVATTGGLDPQTFRQSGVRRNPITGGGLGSLDVGWLNSRNDNVGKDYEAGIWEDTLRYVEDFSALDATPQETQAKPKDDLSNPASAQEDGDGMDQS